MKTQPKLKTYSVLVKAYCLVLVLGAESEDDAMEWADQEISNGDFEIEESRIEEEITDLRRVESVSKHANRIVKCEH